MNTVHVDLKERSYDIYVGSGLLQSAAQLVTLHPVPTSVVVVTHPHLAPLYAQPVAQSFRDAGTQVHMLTVPSGERFKTLRTIERLLTQLAALKIDRRGLIVAVGGGVLGDTVGFAASIWLRGVRFLQIPTTLLAQVDASVGGKTAVDLAAGKNLVGAFHQPCGVVIDTDTLHTLPVRELRSGLAEVVKYGIILDPEFHAQVLQTAPLLLKRHKAALEQVIVRSCQLKAQVVAQDETETGLRAVLNFGHTVGHALETITQYRRYKHGEAISIGMVSACLVGERMGLTPPAVTREVETALQRLGLPIAFPHDISNEATAQTAMGDKKSLGGELRFVLARRIGEVTLPVSVPGNLILQALEDHKQRNK
jgi:3-dehydroquinate synthase